MFQAIHKLVAVRYKIKIYFPKKIQNTVMTFVQVIDLAGYRNLYGLFYESQISTTWV